MCDHRERPRPATTLLAYEHLFPPGLHPGRAALLVSVYHLVKTFLLRPSRLFKVSRTPRPGSLVVTYGCCEDEAVLMPLLIFVFLVATTVSASLAQSPFSSRTSIAMAAIKRFTSDENVLKGLFLFSVVLAVLFAAVSLVLRKYGRHLKQSCTTCAYQW